MVDHKETVNPPHEEIPSIRFEMKDQSKIKPLLRRNLRQVDQGGLESNSPHSLPQGFYKYVRKENTDQTLTLGKESSLHQISLHIQ